MSSGGVGGGSLGAGLLYHKFVSFALEETRLRTTLTPHPSQEKFKSIKPNDDNTVFNALSFSAPKIRLLRSLTIEKKNSYQVLDFAAFSEPEYDLPIFCANVFTTHAQSIVVLDLNPLYDTTVHKDYKDKYYRSIMPLVHKYNEVHGSFLAPPNLLPHKLLFSSISLFRGYAASSLGWQDYE
ncbi:Os01g0949400 [Oryza sativa Japonica Group]|uniref:Os01g0949400 protein n=1 Tax=Oryza sativa subsp. japonica TaxID=39947 RepID=A0A0P0VCY5_ORYSJ|nr:Os01g0949400 [Oryza sativa Japonica Group]